MPSRNATFKNEWRSIFAAMLLLFAGLTANATNFTFNNTGCQTVKVYKVFLLFETFQANVNASQSYNTSSASWGEKWVYRSMNGSYLGTYTIPWVSSCTHNFNSGGGPNAPTVGNITQPTCATQGSVTLNGLPSGNWTLTRNPGGITINGSGSSTTIYNLDAGSYSFSVVTAGCSASASVNAVLNTPPVASSAPALYSTTATNLCPATTVNLNSLLPLFVPSGYTLSWHTGTPANASNKVWNPSAVSAGTYYATFYNAGADCYSSQKTTAVTATVGTCSNLVRNKYRSIDGSMNNLTNSSTVNYGKVGNPFSRELPAAYSDGISSLAGANRPNPRAISNKLSAEREDIHNDRDMAGLFYSWGQFIDHDMTDNATNSAEPANISLPSSESYFTNPIAFNRSKAHPGTGVTSPREQTNLNSAWLDASMVYGLTQAHAQWLRSGVLGKLKTSEGNLLPFNTLTGEYDSAIDPTAPRMDDDQGGTKKTFVAGDHRVAEHPGLTSLHTLFMREHNRICDRLVSEGLSDDEEIYQKARKEVGALIQHITYTQWISSLGVSLKPYAGYNQNVKVDMLNSFSAAAYRWHTMVENDIIFRDNECQGVGPVELPLKDVFFNINIVRNYDIGVLLKGLSVHRSYETDLKVNNGLRNFLGGNFGTDLVSINIQRGRDHGLPSYNEVRKYYTGNAATSFSDITSVDTIAQKMQQLYGSVDNIDIWVGLMAEDHLSGKSIGKTIDAIIRTQFENLRDGDYYYYLNDPELASTMYLVQNSRLGDVIARNSSANNFQDNVFFRKHCSSEGDDIAHHPCSVTPQFEGWTYLGKVGSKTYFKWNGGNLNFADAYDKATTIGGHLPQVKNSTENNAIKGYIGSGSAWLDMIRNGNSWTYSPVINLQDVALPGVACSYFNWNWSEPNNAGGTENRVQMNSSGKWNDISHNTLQPVIAEVECNNNVYTSCKAGVAAPTLKSIYKSNVCPATTVSLAAVTATNIPASVTLTWHTGTPASNANKFTNISAVTAGTYYAAFYDASGGCYSPAAPFKVTINNCNPLPSITINDVVVNENAGVATLTVQLSTAKNTPVTVVYTTANGTAAAGTDYTTSTGTTTFPANSTSVTISIPIVDDNISEPTELLYVNLTSPNGATIADNQGTVTILDNDVVVVCDNITNGGTIGFGTNCTGFYQHCPIQGNAPAITNCTAPSGGSGSLEVVWLKSTTSCTAPTTTAAQIAAGLDPNWTMIPGATGLTLDPGTVSANTCYLRCVRRGGCGTFMESNIISLTISPNCNGGGNGTPDCANISITPGNGSITVGGLGGAPVVSVQIFNSVWQQLHNCFANCGNSTATYAVPAGSYYVYVKYYTANYQQVCEVNQTVNVAVNLAGTGSYAFNFDAIKHMEHTELVWSQRQDETVESYIVERSLDGIVFEEISAQASEKTASGIVYNDFDFAPQTGDNYYRIKMQNTDGSISYSEVKTVRYEEVEDFTVFPNPANGFTNLNLEKYIGKQVDIHIFNNKGLRMKTIQVEELFSKYYQMDLRDLHEGQYFIWVNTEGKRPVAKKLVVGRV